MYSKIFAFLILGFVASSLAFKDGAPLESCDSMTPDHGNSTAIPTPAPYDILLDKKVLKGGEKVRLTVSGRTAEDTIKGFLIQVRSNGERVGLFEVDPKDHFVQPLACGNVPSSAVTHKYIPGTMRSFSVTWIAPQHFNNEAEFHITIVKDMRTFWTDNKSNKIKVEAQ